MILTMYQAPVTTGHHTINTRLPIIRSTDSTSELATKFLDKARILRLFVALGASLKTTMQVKS